MKKQLLLGLITLIPFLIFSQTTKKVLIIGIDGVRSDALEVANTPNLDTLINNGFYSPDALNDDITISGPGWSAMLCSVWSDKHLVTGNDFSNNNYEAYPHIFKYVEEFNSNLHTVSICHWNPINDFIVLDHADFKLNVSTDLDLANQAVAYINVNDPDILFLHFDDVDHAGHSQGFSPEVLEYLQAIEITDNYVGLVMDAIKSRPTYAEEDWLILVSTDHGGKGFSHGGNSLEEQNTFVIASGPNVPTEVIYKDSMIITTLPENCLEDSIELRFDGVDDFVQISPDPIFDFGAQQDFTIECRVRTDQAGDVAIVGNKDWNSGFNKGVVFSFKYPSGPEWKVNIGDGSNRADINTGGLIADNEWHTLSVSFDRDGYMVMYEDGVVVDSADISAIGDITTNEGLLFGTDINGAFQFTGAIAEVRVWNTIIEGSEIAEWHCDFVEELHPNFDNLIGYWKVNEGLGALELTDFSNNDNQGTINGASWKLPNSTVVYDFSNTPRTTDIGISALNHLCIPINEAWGLDGHILTAECMITNTSNETIAENIIDFSIFPNPSKEQVQIELQNLKKNTSYHLEILDLTGTKLYEVKDQLGKTTLDLTQFTPGTYYISLFVNNKKLVKKLVIP